MLNTGMKGIKFSFLQEEIKPGIGACFSKGNEAFYKIQRQFWPPEAVNLIDSRYDNFLAFIVLIDSSSVFNN